MSKLDRSTWQTVRLGDVCTMNAGGTPDSKVSTYYGGEVPWVSIADITESDKELSVVAGTLSLLGLENSSAKLYPENTLLFAMYASIGKCCIARQSVTSSQAILGLYNLKGIDLEFLYYVLSSRQSEFIAQGQTGTQSNLSKEIVGRLEIRLPKEEDQRAIASALSTIDAQISSLCKLIAKQEAIKKATLKLLLTPKPGWQTVKLSKVTTEIKERIACARVALTDYVSTETLLQNCGGVSIASSAPSSGSCIKYEEGDILISNIRPYLKKIWQASHDGGCSNDVIVYRANAEIVTDFLYQTLSADSFFEYDMAYATGTKMPRGDRLMMALYEFALPSLEEQRRITQALHAYDSIIANQKKQLAKMQQLKTGAMRYFFG